MLASDFLWLILATIATASPTSRESNSTVKSAPGASPSVQNITIPAPYPFYGIGCDYSSDNCTTDNITITSCGFTSKDDVVDLAQAESAYLNSTMMVRWCPMICEVIYGSGNPDIAGIGVVYAFGIQLITTFIFGPCFLVARSIFGLTKETPFVEQLQGLQQIVTDTNAGFTVAVGAATIYQMRSGPPIYDVFVLLRMVTAQLLLTYTSISCQLGFEWPRQSRKQGGPSIFKHIDRLVLLFLYWCSCFIIAMYAISLQYLTLKPRTSEISAIVEVCKEYNFQPFPFTKSLIYMSELTLVIGITTIPAFFILHHLLPRAHGAWPFWLYALITTIVSGWLAIEIYNARKTLESGVGSDYQDNQWGFGQITALLFWTPLAMGMLLSAEELIRGDRKAKKVTYSETTYSQVTYDQTTYVQVPMDQWK